MKARSGLRVTPSQTQQAVLAQTVRLAIRLRSAGHAPCPAITGTAKGVDLANWRLLPVED